MKENNDSLFQAFLLCKGRIFLFVIFRWDAKAEIYNNGCGRRTKWLNWLVFRIIDKMVSDISKANAEVESTNMTSKEVMGSTIRKE